MLFNGEAKLGFTDACSVKANCAADEVCVARISNQDQGHIADCNDNTMPMPNAFANRICCPTPKEYCRDGIDNNGNGLIDCADPECHPSANNLGVPQECTPDLLTPPGNNQTTLDCVSLDALGNVVYSPHCLYGVNPFYCSYGEADDPSVPPGYCCAAGTRAVQDADTLEWECRVPTQCGVIPTLSQKVCKSHLGILDF